MGALRRLLVAGSPAQPAALRQQHVNPTPRGTFKVTLFGSNEPLTMFWPGDDHEQVGREFADYLVNPDWDEEGMPPHWRSVQYTYQGRNGLVVFRADWVSGFNVTGGA